jgi:hypothetical protein
VGNPIADDDEALELPGSLDGDDEVPGVAESEELALAEIPDGPEDIGLETETGMLDSFEPGIDDDEEPNSMLLDEGSHDDFMAEVDADGDEGGWLEESEGLAGAFEDDLSLDDDEDFVDDGGLEGVDDPMLDGIEDEEDMPDLDADADEGEDLGEDLLREIVQEGAVTKRS